ncbi:helix-hairpin-helix domain-containing protein [Priestia taiwanensis]|uniref:ComE operon protein 1 n=1 Tax=Priestia taiwanensis TaxID=1347902 RepID=A0A917AU33_9BACI|nr:helix-hairpin-helix domain-containing protein [Priestia taiwanensis]MBM7363720.1 competence protein ComEA [Priestia taiwanensis]GGE74697.1 ComE operon protein 1 [Priestia taiwanensis]
MYEMWLKYKYIVLLGTVIIGISIYYYSNPNQEGLKDNVAAVAHEEIQEGFPSKQQEEENDAQKVFLVDVKGAVVKSGVYELRQGTRIKDAIAAAGGFADHADSNGVNLAATLQDEMVVYVPVIGEEQSTVQNGGETKDSKISINKATSEELQQIPGIGPTRAETIINYREENGPFKKIEDLLEISGIGEKTLEKMKDKIKL